MKTFMMIWFSLALTIPAMAQTVVVPRQENPWNSPVTQQGFYNLGRAIGSIGNRQHSPPPPSYSVPSQQPIQIVTPEGVVYYGYTEPKTGTIYLYPTHSNPKN